MTAAAFLLLGVMLMPENEASAPKPSVPAAVRSVRAGGIVAGLAAPDAAEGPVTLAIDADRADFDRADGVALFDGHAKVEHSGGYQMHAARMFAFFRGSNQLDRIVALGDVALTNGTRYGRCEMAVFRRLQSEIEMYAAKDGPAAFLREASGNAVSGRRIKFWTNVEQVEVSESEIFFDRGGPSADDISRKAKGVR